MFVVPKISKIKLIDYFSFFMIHTRAISYNEVMILLDEKNEIKNFNDDNIADPEFFTQPINQQETTIDWESESD